ncbi:hypothetical protein CkaCkLH20_11243 [Colletotrichum karsti]|uniref:Subtilisin-like serine protease n=1 Tax=Colletotrichum karsti TaxID=1095194 RepID=A0A9P6LGD3_9PEZI|nr:uncharacterized protein CkaCkLH20_11243 [Colletotrichum karsti]KAF9871322.1 hypothetical protein CkaCkLH20_11243 [Colletotrichum karsti]
MSDNSAVENFLRRELSTKRLDDLYFMLFLVSKRNNISPLHHQAIKGRQIVITERPDLHLVWYYDRIFIKPIPHCILNYGFFEKFLRPGSSYRSAAYGFLRTYASLVVHETDFNIAKATGLIPTEVNWENWCLFIENVAKTRDDEVAPRYHYGELRLTRLNFYSKLFLREWDYLETHHQYVDYFSRFLAPYLFVFGAVTVVLAAMQTTLTADPNGLSKSRVSEFCTFSIVLTACGLFFFPVLYLAFQLRELALFLFYRQKAK